MSYKKIKTSCEVQDEYIKVIDTSIECPSPIKVLTAQYWRDEEGHLWKITRDANCMEIKTDLGIIY